MPASINDIAKRAGVSNSTVARALRGDVKGLQKRSAEKAAEILRLSEELGYQPDWRARALSRRKTQTIGLLYSDPEWIFDDPSNQVAVSFTQALQKQNYDLRLIPAQSEEHWKELVYGGAVDGLAMLVHTPEGTEEAIWKSGLPTILLNNKIDGVPHVVPNDVAGAYAAARHLISLGHQRIVFLVSESIRPHVSISEREQGFLQAIDEAAEGVQGNVWRCSMEEAIDRLLAPERPSAVLAYCHVEGQRISHDAWKHGISIPRDLSLIAFNDTMATSCMTPPMSVVGFDLETMGRQGAEMLVRQIEQPDRQTLENVVLRQKLIIRGTTAPPLTGSQHRAADRGAGD